MILIDTHIFLWWIGDKKRLTRSAIQVLKKAEKNQEIAVSAISFWEIALLLKKDRLNVTMDSEIWLDQLLILPGLHIIPIDAIIARESVQLPGSFHADPADRMIVATARILGLPLVTMDKKIRHYANVKTVW